MQPAIAANTLNREKMLRAVHILLLALPGGGPMFYYYRSRLACLRPTVR